MRMSDWSSDVCYSDLDSNRSNRIASDNSLAACQSIFNGLTPIIHRLDSSTSGSPCYVGCLFGYRHNFVIHRVGALLDRILRFLINCRSEEHTSELQSLMRISYAVFCLKKKKKIY